MSSRGVLCAVFLALLVIAVPWYWHFIPDVGALAFLDLALSQWTTILGTALLVGWLSVFVQYEHRQRERAVELADRQRDTAQQRAVQLQRQVDEQRQKLRAELKTARERLTTLQQTLDAEKAEFAERCEQWQLEQRHAESGLAREKIVCEQRQQRLDEESRRVADEQQQWEATWQQRESDLTARSEQLEEEAARLAAEHQRESQRLAELARQLQEKKSRLAAQQTALETQRMQWTHERASEENHLAEWRTTLERREQELEIKMAATSKRFAAQAQSLADTEDQLARARQAWEDRKTEEEQRLASWEERAQRHALELDRRIEQHEVQTAQARSRLEQREAAITEREELLDHRRVQWEEQKRRWEEAVGLVHEQPVSDEAAGGELPAECATDGSAQPASGSSAANGNDAELPVTSDGDRVSERAGDVDDGGYGELDRRDAEVEYAQIDGTDDEDEVPEAAAEDWDSMDEEDDVAIAHRLAMLGRRRKAWNK